MSRAKKNYDWGKCEQCGGSILLKPPQRRFCNARCKSHFNNGKRQTKSELAIAWVSDNLITIPEAVALGYGKETTLRSKVKRGEVKSVRLFGRVLVERRKYGSRT